MGNATILPRRMPRNDPVLTIPGEGSPPREAGLVAPLHWLMPPQLAISTTCHAAPLEDKLAAFARAGFAGVELFESDLDEWTGSMAALGALCRSGGLHVVSLQPLRDVEGMIGAKRPEALARAARWMDGLADMGADAVFICSNTSPDSSGDAHRIVDDLHALAEMAAERGLVVGYEALSWARHVRTWQQAYAVVGAVDRPDVGLIVDTYQTMAMQGRLDDLGVVPVEKIVHVQLADGVDPGGDRRHASRNYRRLPGEGVIPVRPVVENLLRRGYAGWFSLELFDGPHRRDGVEIFAERAALSLAVKARGTAGAP